MSLRNVVGQRYNVGYFGYKYGSEDLVDKERDKYKKVKREFNKREYH